jgi:hypothetical protein
MTTSRLDPDRRALLGLLAAAAAGCAASPAPAPATPPAPAPGPAPSSTAAPAPAAAADPNQALRNLALGPDVEPAFAFRASPPRSGDAR